MTRTYYVTENNGGVRRLDALTLPWVDISVPGATAPFRDIMAFPNDPDRVIAVGQDRQIYYSSDAGATWNASGGNYTALPGVIGDWDFKEIWIVDANTAYVVGPQGVVVKTTDGGVTFDQTATFPTGGGVLDPDVDNQSVHFPSPLIGVVGQEGAGSGWIWKTTDGGATWAQLNGGNPIGGFGGVTAAPGINITADQGQIIFLGDKGCYRSVDNGATFAEVIDLDTNLPGGEGSHLTWIPGEAELWVFGRGESIYKTTNYGAVWSVIRAYGASGSDNLIAAHFYDSNNGFIGFKSSIHTSPDAGATDNLSESGFIPQAIWTQTDNPPPICYTLRSCDTAVYPDIEDVWAGIGVDLASVVGQVILTDDVLGTPRCYTVELQDTTVNPCAVAPDLTVTSYTLIGGDCASFNLDTCPAEIPITIVGNTSQVQVTINNTGSEAYDFSFALGACAATGLSILTASPLNIPAGGSGVITLEYTPTGAEQGTCVLDVTGPCGTISCNVCYHAVAVPDCPHFNICITGPSCAPDCIKPGEVIQFDLGGTISPVAYPTVITFQIVDQVTGDIVFSAQYPVNDDTELDAIVVNVPGLPPGNYCAEVCLPGCNTKRILCFDVCEPFDIYKDECYKWHVHRPVTCLIEEYVVSVYEFNCSNGNDYEPVVDDVTWDVSQDNVFEFEVPSDGIYIFEMKDPTTGEVLHSFSAFETCDLQECFKLMMDKIMCSCSDPCCKACDGSPEVEREFSRMTLNKLVPLYMTYLVMAYRNQLYTVGNKLISDDHHCFLHDACAIMAKITDIITDCGCLCPGEDNTATNRGDCQSC